MKESVLCYTLLGANLRLMAKTRKEAAFLVLLWALGFPYRGNILHIAGSPEPLL